MEHQSRLLRVLRDLTNDNKDLLNKEHSSNSLTSSRTSSQVAVRLIINGEAISRSFPLDSGYRCLTQIEDQVSMIFYPYLSKSKQITKKMRMFHIDDKGAKHVLDTDETLQSILNAPQQSNTEETLLRLRLELVDDDEKRDTNAAETREELEEIECSICGELCTRELLLKCLHCNFIHICCSCQITTNQHENHFTVPHTFLSTASTGTERRMTT